MTSFCTPLDTAAAEPSVALCFHKIRVSGSGGADGFVAERQPRVT